MSNQTKTEQHSDTNTALLILEHYKSYRIDIGNIGSRYTSMIIYYTTIATAIIGMLAFKEKNLNTINTNILYIISFVACLICTSRFASIKYFNRLLSAKFKTLRAIEEHLPVECYRLEMKHLINIRAFRWTKIEQFYRL